MTDKISSQMERIFGRLRCKGSRPDRWCFLKINFCNKLGILDVCHEHLGRIRGSCEWSRYSYFYILIYLTKIRGFIFLIILFLLVLLLSQFIEAKRFGNQWFHCFLRRTKNLGIFQCDSFMNYLKVGGGGGFEKLLFWTLLWRSGDWFLKVINKISIEIFSFCT